LKIVECKEKGIDNIGFININIFDPWEVKNNPSRPETLLLKSLLQHQNKKKIIFPYNFK